MYYQSVGRNATFILGLTPDTAGLVPKADSIRLSVFGKEISKRFATPLITKQGDGNNFIFHFRGIRSANQLVIQEDIAKGERIEAYRLLAKIKGKWKEVCAGTSVGSKRIQVFKAVRSSEFRLVVTKAKALPLLLCAALFNISDTTVRN